MSEVVGGPTTAWDRAVEAGKRAAAYQCSVIADPPITEFDVDWLTRTCLAAAVPELLEALQAEIAKRAVTSFNNEATEYGEGWADGAAHVLRSSLDAVRGFAAEVQP